MRRLSLLAAALVAGAVSAWACGKYFPNRVLLRGDAALFAAPLAKFGTEIERIVPESAPEFQVSDAAALDVGIDEIEAVLPEKSPLLPRVVQLRAAMATYAQSSAYHDARRLGQRADPSLRPKGLSVPQGLPVEFDLYLQGAVAYYQADAARARRAWHAVLDLPEEGRRHRTTWAAFMIGKTWIKADPAQAVACFRKVRTLVRTGFRDPLGLAAASLGWEAAAEIERRDFVRAIELYLEQWNTGAKDLESLRMTADFVFQAGEGALRAAAASPEARRVLTAFVVSAGGSKYGRPTPPEARLVRVWLDAVQGVQGDAMDGADRLGWMAYQAGDMKTARRWLGRAKEESPVTLWLRAKLELRAGRQREAERLLTRVVHRFPRDEDWAEVSRGFAEEHVFYSYPLDCAKGELGVLYLARRQYTEALDVLFSGAHWLDAAYVAERVLTPEELVAFVDGGRVCAPREGWPWMDRDPIELLRYLLARRLARRGRYDEARAYYPDKLRGTFDEFDAALRAGRDAGRAKGERAEMLWRAATIAREQGLELFGTEIEPDWLVLRGNYKGHEIPDDRGTAHERGRRKRHKVRLEKRWHYRYVASEIAWDALALMPDQTERTAQRFCIAGSWLKVRDDQAADRFYKALVRRCGKTALGKKADTLRWFPKLEKRE